MQAKHRKATFRIARLAPIFVAVSMLASCGGDDDGGWVGGGSNENPPPAPPPNSNLIIGASHGDLAPYLVERLGLVETPENVAGAADSLGDVILLSAPNGLSTAHASLPLLQGAFEQGKAVALTHAEEGEVKVLLDALGLEMAAPTTEDGAPYELFAVRRAGGDNHFFVTLGGEGAKPVSPTMTERTITVEGPEDNPTDFQIHEEEVPTPPLDVDEAVMQGARADNFVLWVEETKEKALAKGDEPVAVGASADLRELAEANVWDFDASSDGQTFTIRYTMYSVHSFTNDMDYYFLTQKAQLNPSKLWKKVEGYKKGCGLRVCVYLPYQEGHMRRYLFKNYWGADPGNAVPLDRHSPESDNNVRTVTSGISYSLSGSLGFDGKAATGSLSGGVEFSNSVQFNVSDVTVNDKAGSDGLKYQAAWEYTFANPANGSRHFYWTDLEDAPQLSRSSFNPVNQWVWTVPRAFSAHYAARGDGLRFKSVFTWTNGQSWGAFNTFWVEREPAEDRDWKHRTSAFWVPVKVPPLLAVSTGQVDFSKAGESKAVSFVAALDWTATSSANWLEVQEKSGQKTSADGISMHITAAPNNSGANRTGTITLRSTDGKQKQVLKVFQSKY